MSADSSIFTARAVDTYQAASDSRSQIVKKMTENGELKGRNVKWFSVDALSQKEDGYQAGQASGGLFLIIGLLAMAMMFTIGALIINGSLFNDHAFLLGTLPLTGGISLIGGVVLGISSYLRHRHLNAPMDKAEAAAFIEGMRQAERERATPLVNME